MALSAAGYRVPGKDVRHVLGAALSNTGDVIYPGGNPTEASRRAIQFNNDADDAGVTIPSPGILVVQTNAGSLGPYHVVVRAGTVAKVRQAQAAGGGGAGGGTMSSGAGAAAAAVQAGMPAFTGGGPSFSIGAANVRALLAERADAFMGVDTLTPEQRLDAGYSPDSINWDGFTKIGSRCVRRGCAKMLEDRDNVTIGGSPISADYRGLSIATVLRGGAYGDAMLLAFADNEIGQTRTAQVTTLHLVQNYILWGRPTTLKGWAGPKMALSQIAGPKVRVTTDYTSVFAAATAGMRNNSVIGLVVRYSGPTATESYPLDIDGYDHLENTTTASTALVNRASWLGASRVDDTAVLAVGKYWFTAWAISREGYSEPAFASLTVT